MRGSEALSACDVTEPCCPERSSLIALTCAKGCDTASETVLLVLVAGSLVAALLVAVT